MISSMFMFITIIIKCYFDYSWPLFFQVAHCPTVKGSTVGCRYVYLVTVYHAYIVWCLLSGDKLEKGVTWQEMGKLAVLLTWLLLLFCPCQTEPSKVERLLPPLEELCLALRSFCLQDRTGRRTNSASTQSVAETHTRETTERSQELAYRVGQTYSQTSAHITPCLTHSRAGWNGNPALYSSSSPGLHCCIALCCTKQNAATHNSILLFVFFFFPSALLLNWQIGHQSALCRCRCDAQSGDQFANPDCQKPVSFSSL